MKSNIPEFDASLLAAITKTLTEERSSLRLLKTHTHESGRSAKVYKDTEWGEHRVKFYNEKGEHQTKADYHTDDAEDAHDTAKAYTENGPGLRVKKPVNESKRDRGLFTAINKTISPIVEQFEPKPFDPAQNGGKHYDVQTDHKSGYHHVVHSSGRVMSMGTRERWGALQDAHQYNNGQRIDRGNDLKTSVNDPHFYRTKEAPFEAHEATGRIAISPCCTASVHEFKRDGKTQLAGTVAGHGWRSPHEGKLEDHAVDGWKISHVDPKEHYNDR